jgi:hypothetical protein
MYHYTGAGGNAMPLFRFQKGSNHTLVFGSNTIIGLTTYFLKKLPVGIIYFL